MTKISLLPQAALPEAGKPLVQTDPAQSDEGFASLLEILDQPKAHDPQPWSRDAETFRPPVNEAAAQSIAEWLAKKNLSRNEPSSGSDGFVPSKTTKPDAPAKKEEASASASHLQPPHVFVAGHIMTAAAIVPLPAPPAQTPAPVARHGGRPDAASAAPSPSVNLPTESTSSVKLPSDAHFTPNDSTQTEAVDTVAPVSLSNVQQETHLPPVASLPAQISAAIVQHVGPRESRPVIEPAQPQRVVAAPPASVARPTQVLTLQLEPASLGVVDVRLRLSGETLRVHIDAGRPETLALIDREQGGLRTALESAGYQIDDLTIQPGAVAAPGVKASETLRIEPAPSEPTSSSRDQNPNQDRPSDRSNAFFDSPSRGEGQSQRQPAERREQNQRRASAAPHAAARVVRDGNYV